jgi:hypothetical protein
MLAHRFVFFLVRWATSEDAVSCGLVEVMGCFFELTSFLALGFTRTDPCDWGHM